MEFQKFIQNIKVKKLIKNAQKDFKLDSEFELKLLRAKVEFLNSANEARKNIGLSPELNPFIEDLLQIERLET